MKPFSLILLVLGLLKSCNALLCYRCNALNNPTSNCPGWHRRPVDSLRDLQDRGGLYTHCIDIRLANGTVIYQVINSKLIKKVFSFHIQSIFFMLHIHDIFYG